MGQPINCHLAMHAHTYIHARTYTHSHTYTHARTHTHAFTHTHTHTHSHTHTHTRTHTHTQDIQDRDYQLHTLHKEFEDVRRDKTMDTITASDMDTEIGRLRKVNQQAMLCAVAHGQALQPCVACQYQMQSTGNVYGSNPTMWILLKPRRDAVKCVCPYSATPHPHTHVYTRTHTHAHTHTHTHTCTHTHAHTHTHMHTHTRTRIHTHTHTHRR